MDEYRPRFACNVAISIEDERPNEPRTLGLTGHASTVRTFESCRAHG
jgi:hypothetical protein